MEVRERVERNGQSEGFVLPDVGGSERGNGVENLEVQRLKGVWGKAIVWVDGVEYGVLWETRRSFGEGIGVVRV